MSSTINLEEIEAASLKERVYEKLRDAIFSGLIQTGERLNESELARRFKVSRSPIREALQHLEQEGLIVSHPRRGTFITELTDQDIKQINALRVGLEGMALRLARAQITPTQATHLQGLIERMEGADPETSPGLISQLDYQFHAYIWGLSGNPHLEKMLTKLTSPFFAYFRLMHMTGEQEPRKPKPHRPLLDFLLGQSAMSAEQCIVEHVGGHNMSYLDRDHIPAMMFTDSVQENSGGYRPTRE